MKMMKESKGEEKITIKSMRHLQDCKLFNSTEAAA